MTAKQRSGGPRGIRFQSSNEVDYGNAHLYELSTKIVARRIRDVKQTIRCSMAVPCWIKNEIKRVSATRNETMIETLQRWIVREMQDSTRGGQEAARFTPEKKVTAALGA